MQVTIEKKELVIRLPLRTGEVSKSGKSLIVAGTGGFIKSSASVGGKQVSVAVNAITAL